MAKPINFKIVVTMLNRSNDSDISYSADASAEASASCLIGKVKAIGKSAYAGEPKYADAGCEFKVGDLVYISPYAGRIIPKKDGSYERILNDSNIDGIVEEDDDVESMIGDSYE